MTNQIAALKLLSQKKRTSHVLHLILAILSVGFWVPVWLLVALSNSIENARIDRKVAKLCSSFPIINLQVCQVLFSMHATAERTVMSRLVKLRQASKSLDS